MFNELLKSKRVWAAFAAVAVVVLKDRTGLSEDQITQLVIAVGAWIVGDSLRATTPKVS
jgi:nitrate/nitrite transporter NarK